MPIYWAFLTYILLRPTSDVDEENLWITFDNIDKVVHIFSFIVLGFCYRLAFPKQKIVSFCLVMLGYAMLTEILQEVMELGRTMELMDFIADGIGIFIGYILWKKIKI